MAVVISKKKDFEMLDTYRVKLKTMGNIREIAFTQKVNRYCPIILIDKDHYVRIDWLTGEISDTYECNHIKNRSENKFQVGQSLKRLRDIINTNVVDPKEWKWITLTYGDLMTDTKRLYNDFHNFMRRLRIHFFNYSLDYIVACEPQGRGAWHMHLLLGFNSKAPFIDNETIWKLWSPKGYKNNRDFTKTQDLDDIDNVGAYLTAYLGDMELTEENIHNLSKVSQSAVKDILKGQYPTKKVIDEMDNIKYYIKGARLYMYPPKFNLYRCSKGIKKPIVEELSYYQAKKKVGNLQPTYTTSLYLEDLDNKFSNTYHYEYYNTLRDKRKSTLTIR